MHFYPLKRRRRLTNCELFEVFAERVEFLVCLLL